MDHPISAWGSDQAAVRGQENSGQVVSPLLCVQRMSPSITKARRLAAGICSMGR